MFQKLTVLLITLFSSVLSGWSADTQLEYKVKAVCVLNAARFVDWPAKVFDSPQAPFIIGVMGDNPFGPLLESAVKNETIRHRPIELRKVTTMEAASSCQVLFICRSEAARLPGIINDLNNLPVLTMGESEGFTRAGGILGLAIENGKIRFDLNASAARKAGLNIESQFLMLCRTKP